MCKSISKNCVRMCVCGWKFIIWKEIIPPISDSNKSDLTYCIHKYTQCWQHHKRFCLMRPAVCVCVCICAELQLYHCIKFILKCMCAPWYKQIYLSLLSVKKLRKNAKDRALISAPKWDIPRFPPTQTSTVTSYFSTSNWTAVKATPPRFHVKTYCAVTCKYTCCVVLMCQIYELFSSAAFNHAKEVLVCNNRMRFNHLVKLLFWNHQQFLCVMGTIYFWAHTNTIMHTRK